ncbi:MAG TPA: hypothetical protein QF353_01120 [Gammaproteobacteria bacterium]|nr:hypothetical protein [Gammaproteobacteria bacterium]
MLNLSTLFKSVVAVLVVFIDVSVFLFQGIAELLLGIVNVITSDNSSHQETRMSYEHAEDLFVKANGIILDKNEKAPNQLAEKTALYLQARVICEIIMGEEKTISDHSMRTRFLLGTIVSNNLDGRGGNMERGTVYLQAAKDQADHLLENLQIGGDREGLEKDRQYLENELERLGGLNR